MSTYWFLVQWNMNSDFIWAEFLPAVLKSPCDCASSWVWVPGEALLALERLCVACTPVEGMNSSGGVSSRAPDWLAPPTKQRPCLINNPKQTRSNNNHTAPQAVGQGSYGYCKSVPLYDTHAFSLIQECLCSMLHTSNFKASLNGTVGDRQRVKERKSERGRKECVCKNEREGKLRF